MVTLTASWLLGFGLLFVLGLATGRPLLVALGAIVVLTWCVSWGWNRLALHRVVFHRSFSTRRAFVGETVEVRLHVENRKAVPLPWLLVEDTFPTGGELLLRGEQRIYSISHATSIAGHQRLSWSHALECRERGIYRFGPAEVRSGDIFGFFTTPRTETGIDSLIVYPRTVPLPALGLPPQRPFGVVRGGPRYHEDPAWFVGLREYQPEDSGRRIDWKATARRGVLQVRMFEPTVSPSLMVLLSVETLAPKEAVFGYSPPLLERAVVAAASVSRWALEQRHSVGFLTNGTSPVSQEAIRILPSRNPKQLVALLEGMAVVGPLYNHSMAETLWREAHRLPLGATLVLIAAYVSEELADTFQELQGEGHRITLLWVGETPLERDLPGVRVHDVGGHLGRLERDAPFLRPEPVLEIAHGRT